MKTWDIVQSGDDMTCVNGPERVVKLVDRGDGGSRYARNRWREMHPT